MVGFAAMLSLDASPVNPELLQSLAIGLRQQGRCDRSTIARGPVGLVEVGDAGPTASADGAEWVVGDIRLDRREEIVGLLGLRRERDLTDHDIVLESYRKWGPDAVAKLTGDFAFAVYDAGRRRLFVARDVLGVRQLFYAVSGGMLIVASSVNAVLAATGDSTLNLPFLGDLYRGRDRRWVGETPFRSVSRLPAGHGIVATCQGNVAVRRGDRLSAKSLPGDVTDRECFEQFAELFSRSVEDRCRGLSHVGVLLSGGLDSSAVACQASKLLDARVPSARLRTYSATFARTPTADERDYLGSVLEACPGVVSTVIPADDTSCFSHFREIRSWVWDEPDVRGNRMMALPLLEAARRDGCGAMLTGHWSDELLDGHPYDRPENLRDVPWADMKKEWPHFKRRHTLARMVSQAYLRPLVRAVRRAEGRVRVPSAVRRRGRSATESYRQLTSPRAHMLLNQLTTLAQHAGLELRFPFLDRRLVEFTLGLPRRLRFRDGIFKEILRQGLATIYPEAIRTRVRRSHFSELDARGLVDEREAIRSLLKGSRLREMGLATDRDIRMHRGLVDDGLPYFSTYASLCRFLSLEAWLRQRETS